MNKVEGKESNTLFECGCMANPWGQVWMTCVDHDYLLDAPILYPRRLHRLTTWLSESYKKVKATRIRPVTPTKRKYK